MNQTARILLVVSTSCILSGCVTSLSDKAKLLAASQECGGAEGTAPNQKRTQLYHHCVELQLDAIQAQEAAYEQGQADVLVGLAKALEPSTR
jgi:hypothetical protein